MTRNTSNAGRLFNMDRADFFSTPDILPITPDIGNKYYLMLSGRTQEILSSTLSFIERASLILKGSKLSPATFNKLSPKEKNAYGIELADLIRKYSLKIKVNSIEVVNKLRLNALDYHNRMGLLNAFVEPKSFKSIDHVDSRIIMMNALECFTTGFINRNLVLICYNAYIAYLTRELQFIENKTKFNLPSEQMEMLETNITKMQITKNILKIENVKMLIGNTLEIPSLTLSSITEDTETVRLQDGREFTEVSVKRYIQVYANFLESLKYIRFVHPYLLETLEKLYKTKPTLPYALKAVAEIYIQQAIFDVILENNTSIKENLKKYMTYIKKASELAKTPKGERDLVYIWTLKLRMVSSFVNLYNIALISNNIDPKLTKSIIENSKEVCKEYFKVAETSNNKNLLGLFENFLKLKTRIEKTINS